MERRGSVDNSFKPINLDSLIESSFLCNVLNDTEVELGSWDVWVSGFDLVCFFLGSDGGYNGMTTLEENIEDMGGNETTSTWSVDVDVSFVAVIVG